MKQLTIAEMEQIITMADLVPNIRYYAELFQLKELIDVAKAADFIYGDNKWHGEDCPGDEHDLPEEELPGICECGSNRIREALSKLRGEG